MKPEDRIGICNNRAIHCYLQDQSRKLTIYPIVYFGDVKSFPILWLPNLSVLNSLQPTARQSVKFDQLKEMVVSEQPNRGYNAQRKWKSYPLGGAEFLCLLE